MSQKLPPLTPEQVSAAKSAFASYDALQAEYAALDAKRIDIIKAIHAVGGARPYTHNGVKVTPVVRVRAPRGGGPAKTEAFLKGENVAPTVNLDA